MNWSSKWSKFVRFFVEYEGYVNVIEGLKNTAYIALIGFAIGLIIGSIIGIIKTSSNRNKFTAVLARICDVYVGFFRGTPILVQLLLSYYVLFPLMGINVDKVVVATITFGLNSGAYVSEIIRSGILSIDVGQLEAGRALGLSYSTTMVKIVLPQALKNSIPALGNELITIVKDTSVASIIAVLDLTQAFKFIGSGSFDYVMPYIILALFYLVIVIILTIIIKLIERRLRKGDKQH